MLKLMVVESFNEVFFVEKFSVVNEFYFFVDKCRFWYSTNIIDL